MMRRSTARLTRPSAAEAHRSSWPGRTCSAASGGQPQHRHLEAWAGSDLEVGNGSSGLAPSGCIIGDRSFERNGSASPWGDGDLDNTMEQIGADSDCVQVPRPITRGTRCITRCCEHLYWIARPTLAPGKLRQSASRRGERPGTRDGPGTRAPTAKADQFVLVLVASLCRGSCRTAWAGATVGVNAGPALRVRIPALARSRLDVRSLERETALLSWRATGSPSARLQECLLLRGDYRGGGSQAPAWRICAWLPSERWRPSGLPPGGRGSRSSAPRADVHLGAGGRASPSCNSGAVDRVSGCRRCGGRRVTPSLLPGTKSN